MHYLTFGPAFSIVEDDEQARKYVEAGWQLASRDAVVSRWRARDRAALDALRAVARPVEREVGLPRVFVKHWV